MRHYDAPRGWWSFLPQREEPAKPTSPYTGEETGEFISDWTQVGPGEEVLITTADAEVFVGSVDRLTEDGEILWLHLSNGGGRRLFVRGEGDQVWRHSPNRPV